MTKLTPKRERFCLEMIKPKADQSKAYRKAFNTKKMKARTVHNEASKLMKDPDISARLKELMEPVVEKVRATKEQWLDKMQLFFEADVRKMFNGPGNCVEISELGEAEAIMVEGYELVENFEKVGDKAEHVGYTKKVKLTPKLKAMLEFGKVMGWYTEKKELGLDMTLEEIVRAMAEDTEIETEGKKKK